MISNQESPPDAIIVPTNRRPPYLAQAAKSALELGCTLVTLHSGKWTSAAKAAQQIPHEVDLMAVDVSAHATLRLPDFDTSRLLAPTIFARRTDVSAKRNLALVLSRMLGWKRIVFLHDDIEIPHPEDLRQATDLLRSHDAIGLSLGGFPDDSVVGHAYRSIGGVRQPFINGAALAVDVSLCRSFFPDIYHDAWFYLLDTQRGLKQVGVTGQVIQYPYDPFRNADRARTEELGEVLTEGLYWLLDQGHSIADADERYWAQSLMRRRELIERVLSMVRSASIDSADQSRKVAALKGALGRLSLITPSLCEAYIDAWISDQRRWNQHIHRLPTPATRESALRALTRQGTPKLTWFMPAESRRSELKQPDTKQSKRNWQQVFKHAAAVNLNSYVGDFANSTPLMEAALAAGRLPCPPGLVARSPMLARLTMRLWRLTSPDSPTYRKLAKQGSSSSFEDQPAVPGPVIVKEAPRRPYVVEPRSHPQAEGVRLEKSTLDLFERLFRLQGDKAEQLRKELRLQRSGSQGGTDIVFRASAVDSGSTCLVECKNYTSPLPVDAVASKVLQAEAAFEAEPLDHWILISPYQDPGNELDRLVKRWKATSRFPFTVQIWSPQSGVQDLFALEPEIYRALYGQEPPEHRGDDSRIVLSEFAERLRPPVRLPERLAKYVTNRQSFVQRKETVWLDQLESQIERFGFDENGIRLARPLREEILSVLCSDSNESNVVLLQADFGEGKSFFTVSLCIHLQAQYLMEPSVAMPIPIRLFLHDYRHVSSPFDFLRTQLAQLGLEMEDWHDLAQRNVLVILDGLDEMSVQQDPATTRADLEKIGSLLDFLQGIPVLIATRPHFFLSGSDRERFYDRLRRPHVYRMGQPDRREIMAHLMDYANSRGLTQKLNKIKDLYDPIGVAGKVLYLELLKSTLEDLPEDRFNVLLLYSTYVTKSLKRKIELLREPATSLDDNELLQQLEALLEKIAVEIHISGEGSVNLREFMPEAGGAAKLLWRASRADDLPVGIDEDATARIGSRSLLRRVASETENDDEEIWSVDFFHRSMKEYFLAKALRRALDARDPFEETRRLLIRTPIQREIIGFFRLLAIDIPRAPAILASLAHSARVGSEQGILGGGSISLYHSIGGRMCDSDWQFLDLDGALLAGADISGSNLRASSLRGADLSLADLVGTDLNDSDLTEANLAAGGQIVALSADVVPQRYVCLTAKCELGRITINPDDSLSFSDFQLPRTLQSPEVLSAIAEDIVLIAARSELMIVDIGSEDAKEITYFRTSYDLRSVAIVDRSMLGLLFETEPEVCEAVLTSLDTGEVIWRIPIKPHGQAYEWMPDGIVVAYGSEIRVYRQAESFSAGGPLQLSIRNLSIQRDRAVAVTNDGQVAWLRLDCATTAELISVHSGAGTVVATFNDDVLTAWSDASVVLVRRDSDGAPRLISHLERRLRCAGAKVKGLKRERERLIFLANGADEA